VRLGFFNFDQVSRVINFNLLLNRAHFHQNKPHAYHLLLIRRVQRRDKPWIFLAQLYANSGFFSTETGESKDVLRVAEPLDVFRMREAVRGVPVTFKFDAIKIVGEVTTDRHSVETGYKVFNGHQKDAITRVPIVDVPVRPVSLSFHDILVVHCLFQFFGPDLVCVAEISVPLLRPAPGVLKSNQLYRLLIHFYLPHIEE
jgi:hypothetical protein